jgi:hypothetical protein
MLQTFPLMNIACFPYRPGRAPFCMSSQSCWDTYTLNEHCLLCTDAKESVIFNELPAVLQTGVAFAMTHSLLENSDVFSCLDSNQQRQVASRLKPLTVAPGHDLARQGDDATSLWILQEGEPRFVSQMVSIHVISIFLSMYYISIFVISMCL